MEVPGYVPALRTTADALLTQSGARQGLKRHSKNLALLFGFPAKLTEYAAIAAPTFPHMATNVISISVRLAVSGRFSIWGMEFAPATSEAWMIRKVRNWIFHFAFS